MPEYITKEEFEKECKGINDRIDDLANNHLDTIFNAIVLIDDKFEKFCDRVDRKINKVYIGLGAGFGLLAVVLTMLQVFG